MYRHLHSTPPGSNPTCLRTSFLSLLLPVGNEDATFYKFSRSFLFLSPLMVFHSHTVLRCWPGRVIIPLFFTRLIKDTACASGYFSFFIVSGMEKNRIGLEMERSKRVWKPEPILWDLSSNHKVSPNLYDHLLPITIHKHLRVKHAQK